jgi:hypothetical protein
MNFDFPAPYDHEVPRRIGEARQELSPEGVEVLEMMLAESADPEDVGARIGALPTSEGQVLMGLASLFQEAYDAQIQEHRGWADLHRQMLVIFQRAGELEPEFAARVRRDEATTGEAVAILKRHGEPPGVSDEVLEMLVEVPEE